MFAGFPQVYGIERSTVTTVQGTMAKTSLLLAIMSATALWAWYAVASDQLQVGVLPVSVVAALILAVATIFKPTLAPWTSPVYAAMEGVALGMVSQFVEMRYGKAMPGIALQAVMLTAGTLLVMLVLYGNRIIRVTDRLKAGVIMATGSVCLFYFVSSMLMLFGVHIPFVFSVFTGTTIGIGFSLFVVGLAAFNLLLDFDFIEEAAARQAPKYMEWYGAFGLLLTLVWLYLEMLRLLAKIASNRD
jgi:uncharacterized YccA/Bax inhibitor family protein